MKDFRVFGVVALAWGCPNPANAQRVSIDAALRSSDKPYVQVIGEATVSAKPDQALIEVGVVTQGPSVSGVAAQSARQTEAVLAELRKLPGGNKQLRTTTYSVRPNFQYPKPGTAATIAGYTATNLVEIKLDDLSQVGKVIDIATQSGANSIQKLQYGLKNPRGVRAQALREAAEEARADADAIAAGLGLKVLRVLSAEQTTDEESGMYKKASVPGPPGPPPPTTMEIGTIEVTATIVLRVEIGE